MHFFIDPSKLVNQTAEQEFGPQNSGTLTSPVYSSDVYNLTSGFEITDNAAALACVSGMMIVQQSSVADSLVNLILKPIFSSDIELSPYYYVYRGLEKSSLVVDGNSLVPQDTSNNELVARIWSEAPPQGIFPLGTAAILGYDQYQLSGDISIKDIFSNLQFIHAIFVKEGEWIGDFAKEYIDANNNNQVVTNRIGFEVILPDINQNIDLYYVRAGSYSIDVSALSDDFLKRSKREEVLSYLDPAAFYGMHYLTGVNFTEFSPSKTTTKTNLTSGSPNHIYTKLISKFATKNRVYLDIRSERGYSYNFYQNYQDTSGNNIQVGSSSSNLVTKKYETHANGGWPIVFIDNDQTSNSTDTNKIIFKLRIDDNTKPIIYLENKNRINSKNSDGNTKNDVKNLSNFLVSGKILTNPLTDWSEPITLYYPNFQVSGSTKDNIAFYIKLYYYRQINSDNSPLTNIKYYDSAFCPISTIGDNTNANQWIKNPDPFYIREKMQEEDGTGNFGFVAENGAYWDDTRVLLYSKILLQEKPIHSEKRYLNTYSRKLELNNDTFAVSPLRQNLDVICREYTIDGSQIKILGINAYETNGGVLSEKEDLMLLGLSVNEMTAIKSVNDNNLESQTLSNAHNQYIFLLSDPNNPLTDDTVINGVSQNYRYHRYTIQVQGLTESGDAAIITPTIAGQPIYVYSRDNQFFNSSTFSGNEELTSGINRIEFHIYHDGVIKINDNIDLSLIRKSVVNDENTVIEDTAIQNDLSNVQQIYYLYYDENAVEPNEICSFNIVMANKMKRIGTVYDIPQPEYQLSITYSSGSAKRSFTNENGDIITTNTTSGTGGTIKKYGNQKKKVYMVHFVTEATTQSDSLNEVFNSLNNQLGIEFTYSNTQRRYVDPALAAGILGALIRTDLAVICTGFGFGDASSYPSAEHVNGTAMDSSYFQSPPNTWQQDVDFISALSDYGIILFRTGQNRTTLNTNLSDESFFTNKVRVDTDAFIINSQTGETLHDSHLHSAYIKLNE